MEVQNTWAGIETAAHRAGAKFPELVAAQWVLESDWGKSMSGKFNCFGLKGEGTSCVTGEVIDGKEVTIVDEFLNFPALQSCVDYLVSRWYKPWQGYKGVNEAKTLEDAAHELVRQGYATDPKYATKLLKLVEQQRKAAPKEQILLKIEATQDTWLKKAPEQAAALGDDEKVLVEKGRVYGVSKWYELPADAHAKVTLAAGAGEWYVFQPHWKKVDQSSEAVLKDVDWRNMHCLVTPNLSVGEILQWDPRRSPSANSRVRIKLLQTAREFQRVRDAWGRPLGVTSFYRPEPINTEVGGVPGSRHVTGEAFDIYPIGASLDSFYRWISVRWTGGLGDGRSRGFVHLDTRGGGGFVPGAGVRPAAEWDY
jgi:hypothetical protein